MEKDYYNRKIFPRLSKAIDNRKSLDHEDFVTAKINWRKYGRQKNQNRLTMTVVTNNLYEKAEMARYMIQVENKQE